MKEKKIRRKSLGIGCILCMNVSLQVYSNRTEVTPADVSFHLPSSLSYSKLT